MKRSPELIIAAAVIAVFGRILTQEFVLWDDYLNIVENPNVNPPSWRGLAAFWSSGQFDLFIPISYSYFAALALISNTVFPTVAAHDIEAIIFKAGNLALHTINALLVYRILENTFKQCWPACLGALLFALHPLQVESVAWITEARGLLCSTFCLIAIRYFLLSMETERGESVRDGNADYLAASGAYALALLSKPAAVAIPGILLVLCWYKRRPLPHACRSLVPWLMLAAAVVWLSRDQQTSDRIPYIAPLLSRPLIAGDALLFYLGKLIVPLNLTIVYGRTPQSVAGTWTFYLGWIVPLGLLAVSVRGRYRAAIASIGILLCWLAPVLGLLPFSFQQWSTVADRYMYLAMLGPAFALAAVTSVQLRPAGATIWAMILTLLGALAFCQAGTWNDSVRLLEHNLRRNPGSPLAHNNLGVLSEREGGGSEAMLHYRIAASQGLSLALHNLGRLYYEREQHDLAEPLLRDAIERRPYYGRARVTLGRLLDDTGRQVEAVEQFEAAIEHRSDVAAAHHYIGEILARQGRLGQAAGHLEESLALSENRPDTHLELGRLYLNQARIEEAERHLKRALIMNPDLPAAHELMGVVNLQRNQLQKAIYHFRRALEFDPDSGTARQYLNRLLSADPTPPRDAPR